MAEVISMPLLSDTMEEGTVAAWHKKVGDKVEIGDLLSEIETDKATMDFEAPFDGTLLHIGVEAGDSIPVGQLLAIIGEEGEDVSGLISGAADDDKEEPSPEASKGTSDAQAEVDYGPKAAPGSDAQQPQSVPQPTDSGSDTEGRIKASPLARAMAKERNIDLGQVQGTGENGRIVKRDIEQFEGTETPQTAQPQPEVAKAPVSTAQPGEFTEVKVSQMRKTIARRLSESKFSAPHFYLTVDIDMDHTMRVRKQLNETAPTKISFNDLIIKAAAMALRRHPEVNASWMGDHMQQHKSVHMGVAVAVEDGLMVPVVRNADHKSLTEISGAVREFAEKARNRKLQPDEMQGNTFTISNLGMFGIEEFTAIINPPAACIMAVGGIRQTPVVKDGQVVPGNRMKVTLSCDHRVVDGAIGAQYLQTFREMLEDPMMMLV